MGTMMACTLPDVIRLVISSKKDQKISKIVNKFCFILKDGRIGSRPVCRKQDLVTGYASGAKPYMLLPRMILPPEQGESCLLDCLLSPLHRYWPSWA